MTDDERAGCLVRTALEQLESAQVSIQRAQLQIGDLEGWSAEYDHLLDLLLSCKRLWIRLAAKLNNGQPLRRLKP